MPSAPGASIGPEVMLAFTNKRGETPDQLISQLMRDDWWFEIKFDGVRAVVQQDSDGNVTIYNRRRSDITKRYPDVVEAVRGAWVGMLDGEIVALAPDGRPDFARIHLRDAQSTLSRIRGLSVSVPATFMPFDVLFAGRVDQRGKTYEQRRKQLLRMVPSAPVATRDGATMWRFVKEHGLEGMIAKRPMSMYRAGRQQAWVKLKLTKRISVLVCGIIPGRGSRGDIGALAMCLWDAQGKQLVSIGSVGSGLSTAALSMLAERLGPGQPPLVVEVEYLDVSPQGQLRMPVYRGVRGDVAPGECTVQTLPAARAAVS